MVYTANRPYNANFRKMTTLKKYIQNENKSYMKYATTNHDAKTTTNITHIKQLLEQCI